MTGKPEATRLYENMGFPPEEDHDKLLNDFNGRDRYAFGKVYMLFYSELHHFAVKIHQNTEIVANDVLHDIFVNIWQNDKLVFAKLENIKAYVYISIRNQYRNYLIHKKSVDKYRHNISTDEHLFVAEIAESEVYSIINQALDLLPEDCATVFKNLLEGWSIKEIAQKLNKPERTVYSKKAEAVAILKRKLSKKHLFILLDILP